MYVPFVTYYDGIEQQQLDYVAITKEELIELFEDARNVLIFDSHKSWADAVVDIIDANPKYMMSGVTMAALHPEPYSVYDDNYRVLRHNGRGFLYTYRYDNLFSIVDVRSRRLFPCAYTRDSTKYEIVDTKALFDAVFDAEEGA